MLFLAAGGVLNLGKMRMEMLLAVFTLAVTYLINDLLKGFL